MTNGLISRYFFYTKMFKTGCPLSPLLFAFAIEPLAEAIRSTPSKYGLHFGELRHKITLHCDDIPLFLSNPETSVPALVKMINLFSTFSRYKINLNKSEAMPLGSLAIRPNIILSFQMVSFWFYVFRYFCYPII